MKYNIKKLKGIFNYNVYYPLYYRQLKLKQFLKRNFWSGPAIENKYLFILSPPFCGSTLMNEFLCTSRQVSSNNGVFTREGQRLPGASKMMFETGNRWDENLTFDWAYIKKEWRKYWDISKPILLEKSPPNILRAEAIQREFSPAFFICLYRNPYAHVESIINRVQFYSLENIEEAAEFAVKCLRFQKKNMEVLDNVTGISYEELTSDPLAATGKIIRFLPDLEQLNPESEFKAHNFKDRKLKMTNLNEEKIKKFSTRDLNRMNAVFLQHEELLAFFNYQIIRPALAE